MPIKASRISDILEKDYQTELNSNFMWMLCALLVIGFISVGTATLMAARIYARKTEIGVRKAVGFSTGRIARLFSGEVITIGVIAWLLACVLYIFFMSGEASGTDFFTLNNFDFHMALYGFLIMLVQVIPSCIISLCKLEKMQPKNLIGGKE